MAETIWKFPLTSVAGSNSYYAEMPENAKALSAGFEYREDAFVVWAVVDPTAVHGKHFFHIAGTGHNLPNGRLSDGLKFLNRVEVDLPSGRLIFHVFDTGQWDTRHG
jgi:hypothetical protein